MAKNKKPYEGNLEDLIQFGASRISEFFIVKFQGKTISIGNQPKKDTFHITEGYAKMALRNHIYNNFCQGHYWHKGKKNTFENEHGWMRNSGMVAKSQKDFKVMAAEMTEWLLVEKIFTIEKITI
jgi:hypothetical protein